MSGDLSIGIDLGTSGVRVVAVSHEGATVAAARRALHSHREAGRHEQDPVQWWQCTAEGLAEATAQIDARRVTGIAVCSTSGTVTVLDAGRSPVLPGLMYDDLRAADHTPAVRQAGADLWRRMGYRPQPSWALSTLAFLATTDPGVLHAKGNRLAHQADVVTGELIGGDVATDTSHGLKSGADLLACRWPAAVFDALGVPTAILPELVLPGTRLGTVSTAAAQRSGLRAGTPVFAGMTDGCAAALGSGAVGVGDWNSVLGTTLVLKGVTERLRPDPTGALYSHRGAAPDTWLPGGASGVGAGSISALLPGHDPNTLTGQALRSRPLPAYPLLGRGERFPFVNAEAHGFCHTGDAERPWDAHLPEFVGAAPLLATILHSVSCVERLAFETLARAGFEVSGSVRITGGASGNAGWNRLRATMLQRPLLVPHSGEPATGMAVLATWAADPSRRLEDVAAAMVRIREVVDPEPDARAIEEYYQNFRTELVRRGWLDDGQGSIPVESGKPR
ncbi:MAG: FGGY-family carbohydrate kinase [Sciscionella sp.]